MYVLYKYVCMFYICMYVCMYSYQSKQFIITQFGSREEGTTCYDVPVVVSLYAARHPA